MFCTIRKYLKLPTWTDHLFLRLINLLAVEWYGESEFWAALGKVLLSVGLIVFTFVVMLGGNPIHDRFGFRYWIEPGAFAELYYTGALGRWLGFLQCLIQASFVSRSFTRSAYCAAATPAVPLG